MLIHDAKSDGVHEIGRDHDQNGRATSVTHFDFGEVDRLLGNHDPEDSVSWSDMTAAFSLLLSFCTGRTDSRRYREPSIIGAGWRVHALVFWLDSGNARYSSLQEIAEAAGVTKAAVSKELADLRRELGEILPFKRSFATDSYRNAQIAAMAAGRHASQVKRHKQLAEAS
jgi:hypothetical protein